MKVEVLLELLQILLTFLFYFTVYALWYGGHYVHYEIFEGDWRDWFFLGIFCAWFYRSVQNYDKYKTDKKFLHDTKEMARAKIRHKDGEPLINFNAYKQKETGYPTWENSMLGRSWAGKILGYIWWVIFGD